FLCSYPLAFVQRGKAAAQQKLGQSRYYLHSCMGARVAATAEAYAVEADVRLEENIPFVVAPDGSRLLYLWPLVAQRVAEPGGRHTLYLFEEIDDTRDNFLGRVRYTAIDVRDQWRHALRHPKQPSDDWLFEGLRRLPAVKPLPPKLALAELLVSAGFG